MTSPLRVRGFGGFRFRGPWVKKLGTRASPSKVDTKDNTGQLVKDCMIGSLVDKRGKAPKQRVNSVSGR